MRAIVAPVLPTPLMGPDEDWRSLQAGAATADAWLSWILLALDHLQSVAGLAHCLHQSRKTVFRTHPAMVPRRTGEV